MAQILRAGLNKLWHPGQVKPAGIPRINWDHTLSHGLIFYWLDSATGNYVDLVSGNVSSIAAGGTWASVDSSPYGSAVSFSNTVQSQGQQAAGDFFRQTWAAPFSFATGWYQRSTPSGSTPTFFQMSDAVGNDAFACFIFSGNISANFSNQSASSLGATANNRFNVVVGSATGASAASFYLNGGAAVSVSATTSYSAGGVRPVINSFGPTSTTGSAIGAQVFFGGIWSRALSREEALLLYTDPYCFLLPQETLMPALLAPSAAAPSFGWAIQQPDMDFGRVQVVY